MPISSGANGWPIRHFRKAPPAPEPKLKRFINVMPHDTYYLNDRPPVRPPVAQTKPKPPPPSPSPPPSPEPRRKRYTPSPDPEPGCFGRGGGGGGGCGGCGGACGKGCCARLCVGSACCWSDDDYRNFGQRGRWWSRGGGAGGRGCCGSVCCRCWLALLLGLLFLLLLLAIILALIFGLQAYNRRSTVTTINGQNVYYSVLGKYQNCTDPSGSTPNPTVFPLCNVTTTSLGTTPLGFTTPYADPTNAGGSAYFPTGGATLAVTILVLMLNIFK